MTFAEFCGMHGITKAEVQPLFDYWVLLRMSGMRRFLKNAKAKAR